MKNALKVSVRILSVPNPHFGQAEQKTFEAARILRGRGSEGEKTCLCGLSSQPILPLGLPFNSSLQVSQRCLIEEASAAAFTPWPLGKAASRCKVVYPFHWLVLVSLANVEKVPSSVCCAPTRKSLYSGSWLRHQNQPDCCYVMVIYHAYYCKPSCWDWWNETGFLYDLWLDGRRDHRWQRRDPEWAGVCLDKLLTFIDQLSLIHFLYLPHIRLSPVTISRRCQPHGTLGN